MQGLIMKLLCSVGQSVRAGQVLAILEAMKMENEILAPVQGVVREICVKAGEQVAAGQRLILID
ncbi:MAG: biotin/lipoyl-containing protein [Thermoplasmatota archaeon]